MKTKRTGDGEPTRRWPLHVSAAFPFTASPPHQETLCLHKCGHAGNLGGGICGAAYLLSPWLIQEGQREFLYKAALLENGKARPLGKWGRLAREC